MPDIWQRHFNNGNLFDPQNPDHDPHADPDGDGWTNLQESIAGTDPFDPNPPDGRIVSHITYLKDQEEAPSPEYPDGRIIDIAIISWDTVPGKQYTLLFSPNLTAESWLAADVPYYGDGLPAAATITLNDSEGIAPDKLFWRVEVADLDSDGDGLTDYEELLLGTNPYLFSTDGTGIPDGWKYLHAGQFSIWPSELSANLPRNQSEQRQILLSNDTASPVNYSVTIPENINQVYSVQDSLTGNAVYQWQDINTTGQRLANISNHSNATQPVDLTNFAFPFFGNTFDRLHISNNGFITFGSASAAWNNLALPSTGAPANLIAPFWDNLSTYTIGDIYFQEQASRLIIQYENVGRDFGGTNHAYTFQVVLFADGRIQFHYKTMIGTVHAATIGIQDSTRQFGVQLVHNAPYIVNEMAVEISTPSTFLTISPTTGTVPAQTTLALDASFQSTVLPSGVHTATITTTHDSAAAQDNPLITNATLEVLDSPATVSLSRPANDTLFVEGYDVTLTANATDSDGIAKVEFYNGSTKIAEVATLPYTAIWNNSPIGIHSITAHAIDIFGGVTISEPVIVTVFSDSNGDGVPDEWKIANGLDPLLDSDPYGDIDGDRIPYIWEFHHQSDPNDIEDFPQISFEVDPATGDDDPNDNVFTSITAAIDAANTSQIQYPIIFVRGGIYHENITLSGLPVLLLAELGSVEGPVEIRSNQNGPAVTIDSDSIVDGFIITHQTGFTGPGVSVIGNSPQSWLYPRLINCMIKDNEAESGAGISITDRDLTMIHCTVFGNHASHSAPGIDLEGAVVRMFNTVVNGNHAPHDVPVNQIEMGDYGMVQTTDSAPSIIGDHPAEPSPGWLNMDPQLSTEGYADAYSRVVDIGGLMDFTVVLFDIQGQPRPHGMTVDIGADEFVPIYTVDPGEGTIVNSNVIDTDGDGIPDQWEIANNFDPEVPNSESDLQAYLDSGQSSGSLEIHTPLQ